MVERLTPVSSAQDISQFYLDRSAGAMMAGDFETFLSCFTIPHTIVTFEAKQVLSNLEEFREVFDRVRENNQRMGVTQMVRNCIEACFEGEDTVLATHVSRMLNGDQLVMEPYPCFSRLIRVQNGWKVAHSEYALPRLNSDVPTLIRSKQVH